VVKKKSVKQSAKTDRINSEDKSMKLEGRVVSFRGTDSRRLKDIK